MKLTVVSTEEEILALRKDWQELLKVAADKSVFLCFEWVLASYRNFKNYDQIYLIVVRDANDCLVATAPLVISLTKYRKINVKGIGFLQNRENPANNFLVSEQKKYESLTLILEHLCLFQFWDFIHLDKVDVEGDTGKFLSLFLTENKLKFGMKDNRQSPFITIDCGWDEFWKTRSNKFRKTMRHKLNRVYKDHTVEVEKRNIADSCAPELDEIFEISANSWKNRIGKDLSSHKDSWNFFKELFDVPNPKRSVTVWLLKINGESVAYELHIEYENVTYPIRADFDEGHKEYSPGSVLEYEIIKQTFNENKLQEYNSCGHNYDYLLKWTSRIRDHRNFEIFNNKIFTLILYKFEYYLLPMLRNSKLAILMNDIRKKTH